MAGSSLFRNSEKSARLLARNCAASEAFTSQQIVRLCAVFHREYVAGDKVKLEELSTSMLEKLHLLRAREVSMLLNHLAFSRVVDKPFWQKVSDRLPEIYLDPDSVSLSLSINAFARALLKHETALQFMTNEVMRLANRGSSYLTPRSISMVVNGMSKLRIRDEKLMRAMSFHSQECLAEMRATDLSMVANGFARLWINDQKLFDALEEPLMAAMPDFNVLHLAAVAHAHGRFLRRNEALLQELASQLWQRCQASQEEVDALSLSSIMHAFATRLDFSSSDFIQVVRFCLPRKAEEMLITDLVLTVGAAKRMEGLPPDPQLWEPLFRHCLRLRPEFAPSAVVVVLELALQLRHGSAEFWHTMLSHCASLLEASSYYEASHISTLALLFADLCAGPTTPFVMPDDLKNRTLTAAASALLELHGQCEVANLADLAIAFVRADVKNEMLQRRILAQATRHLAEIAVTGSILRVADHHHARRLLAALCHTHGKEIVEMNHHIALAAKFLEFVPGGDGHLLE